MLFVCSAVSLLMAVSTFDSGYRVDAAYELPVDSQVPCTTYATYRTQWCVDPEGTCLAYINVSGSEVDVLDLSTDSSRALQYSGPSSPYGWSVPAPEYAETLYYTDSRNLVAGSGRRPENVMTPIALKYALSGELLVSDLGNRRVSVFGRNRVFARSFLLPSMMNVPSDVRLLDDGGYLLAGLLLDTTQSHNAGFWCHVTDSHGTVQRSFAYTPESAIERNLWIGVSALIDIDSPGRVAVLFTNEPVLYLYDIGGQLLQKTSIQPDWWVPPPALPSPQSVRRSVPEDFLRSWTRPVKLLSLGEDRYLVAYETNRLAGVEEPFILQVWDARNRENSSEVTSLFLPVSIDAEGNVFMVSPSGDRLVRARWRHAAKGDD